MVYKFELVRYIYMHNIYSTLPCGISINIPGVDYWGGISINNPPLRSDLIGPFLAMCVCNWRASTGVQIQAGAVYICIYVWRCVCHNSSACHAYITRAELGHCHFLYVPAILNVVTIGNGTGTKNVLNGTVSSLLSTALLL